MSMVNLQDPVITGGIRNINWVNGRVVTAEALNGERKANLQRQRNLGKIAGTGVAQGLEVTLAASSVPFGPQSVHITAGVAVNPNGEVLALASDVDVSLTAPAPATPADPGLFQVCQPPATDLANPGIYILTIGPAAGYEQRVPVVELVPGGIASSCGNAFATQGVQFRMVQAILGVTSTGLRGEMVTLANNIQSQLDSGAPVTAVAAMVSKFRNGVAHLCYGTDRLANFTVDPFAYLTKGDSFASYGLIDELRDAGLITACEVPIALLYWTRSGVQYTDLWSVRRPLTADSGAAEWSPLVGIRRPLETLSMYLQFQQQVEEMVTRQSQAALSTVRAIDYFRFLPPAGLIPLGGFGSARGFDSIGFFNGHTTGGPVYIEGILLEPLLRESLSYQPVDLADQQMMWLYAVRENMQAIASSFLNRPVAYLVFATGHIPYKGDAHYDLSRFDFSNFALPVAAEG